MDARKATYLRGLFDAHKAGIEALQKASGKMLEAIHAHEEALVSALKANQSALDLLDHYLGEAKDGP